MTHLTDEQFEDILQGRAPEPDHVATCEQCKMRLTEQMAVRGRLRSAFESVTTDKALKDRVRAMLPSGLSPQPRERPAARVFRQLIHHLSWPTLAAAAILVVAIPVIIFLASSEPATAAEELYRLHEHSLSPHTDLHAGRSPQELAVHLKDKLGFRPAFPQPGVGMTMRGCCVTHFREKPAGSYVVDTDRGVISIIVLSDRDSAVGLTGQMRYGGRTYEIGSFAKCQMAAIELDGYTYCAVGEASYEFLIELLDGLTLEAR